MATFLSILLCFIGGLVGLIIGLGRTLVLVGAALTGLAMTVTGDYVTHSLQTSSLDLSNRTITLLSYTISIIVLPVLAALGLKRLYTAIRLPWFPDRLLSVVLGIVAGDRVAQWLLR